jgi:hypothetical protein
VGRREAERRRRKEARRRCGPVILVEELAIGLLSELQWLVGMLFVLRIERGKQWWRLPTVSRDDGGDRAAGDGRSRRGQVSCACANARARVLEALGGTRDPGEDSLARKQELASWRRAWRSRRRSGRSSVTWRAHGQASAGSGGRRHDRGMTRGTSEGRRWRGRCCGGEQRRRAARADGGRRGEGRGGQREGGKRRGRGRGGTWQGLEQRRVCRGGAHGRENGGAHGRENGGGARQRRTEEREREVDEEGPGCKIQKRQGLHCNA